LLDILKFQFTNLKNSFTNPNKNIKYLKDKNILSIISSFIIYLILFHVLINGFIVLIEKNAVFYLPLMGLSLKYLLFGVGFSLFISFGRMIICHFIFNLKKLKHSRKFNKKIMKNALVYYLNAFFLIGLYININMYINNLIPAFNIFFWGLILMILFFQISQSFYISYTPYFKQKTEVRNYLFLSGFVNLIVTFLLYVFLLNPILEVLF
jgi:hypothetical protein